MRSTLDRLVQALGHPATFYILALACAASSGFCFGLAYEAHFAGLQ